MKPVIYAMAGPIGSGKTTLAKRIAIEKRAVVFTIDQFIKMLRQPIRSAQDYENYYWGVRDIVANLASQVLFLGTSVVFDFGGTKGHWDWLKPIAESASADIEIHNLIVPLDVRRERVRARNLDPDAIFRFSDEDFDSMPKESITPEEQPGLRIIEIHD